MREGRQRSPCYADTAVKKRSCRIKLGERDVLTVVLHPKYVHFFIQRPGMHPYLLDWYLPRSKLLPLIKWFLKNLAKVPRRPDFYVPDESKRYWAAVESYESDFRAAKRQRRGPRRRRRK